MLIDSHVNDDTKEKVKAHFFLEHICDFCSIFQKKTKGLGFEIKLKTSSENIVMFIQIWG